MAQDVRPFTVSASILTRRLVSLQSVSPNFTLPLGIVYLRPLIDVTDHRDKLTTLTVTLDVSFDNGVTWPLTRSVSRDGGDIADEASFELDVPEPDNPLRKTRISITIDGRRTAVITQVTLQAGT